jgi:GR25 family glycosyltransferase involved in LPS biosynthesis
LELDGYFINLARSEDRRSVMEAQIAALGCNGFIERFNAIDGRALGPFESAAANGIWACRQSHTEVILNADPHSTTLVLEDDLELSQQFEDVANPNVLARIADQNAGMDVLFFDCYPNKHFVAALLSLAELHMPNRANAALHGPERHHMANMGIVDASMIYNACTAAYAVTPKGKQTLRALFSEQPDAAIAIDALFQHWIRTGALKARIGVPFIATPARMSGSTIEYQQTAHIDEMRLTHAVRRLLFAGAPNVDLDWLRERLHETPMSPEYRLGMQLFDNLWTCSGNP